MNFVEDLKKAGVEIPEELVKKYTGEFVTRQEMEKKLDASKEELKAATERAEKAEETLKGFNGQDYETISKQLETAREDLKKFKETQAAETAAREKNDLLKAEFEKYSFTSEAAKKAIFNEISNDVVVKNGQLVGFNDLMAAAQKNDAGAFVSKAEQNKVTFTGSFKNEQGNTGMLNKKDFIKSLGSIKSASDRQELIKENISLFTQNNE